MTDTPVSPVASPNTDTPKKYLTRTEAAAYLTAKGAPISKTTLAKIACLGDGPRDGPRYRQWGNKCVYTEADLDEWIEKRMGASRSSTSEIIRQQHPAAAE